MIKKYQLEVSKIYEDIRNFEKKSLHERRDLIKQKIPQIFDIEKQISKLCLNLSMSALNNTVDNKDYLKLLREKTTNLRIKKSELLVSNGYPIDFLDMHYKCSKCNDTGFIGIKKCDCYKQKLVKLYYENSDLKNLLTKNNFDKFSFELFSAQRNDNEYKSPRKNMQEIVSNCWSYIENFRDSNENIMFFGNSGTGKTFLSICIAKELLDKGYLVVYRTSEILLQDLKSIRFNNDKELEDLILNCDLLIVDDLGSEQITDFSKTELFNFLNTKLLKQKKMLISTNCSLETLLKNYSERISSRLLGEFTLHKFYGEDIRIKKNIHNKRNQ
ncbi:DNA replication protein DnaC [Clostridium fermenticellae]|uniref:DNA replication protein DnaC n=1 Tax=Clostridium fermenticellae TaxID=2068654 RepID=A0A386H737_9CLOT|nr:ATP-binding protein [Clostridium fermenticellae]AYD41335.1 DNA replication protein DnaC [Clostridium fermenticellae]